MDLALGYGGDLSYREEAGAVGMPEHYEYYHVLKRKIAKLAEIIKKSKHLVVFTGAGISTSCGFPDFRGPRGVWTLQSKGLAVPEPSVPFHLAIPSITHMALVKLMEVGILKFVVSQNIDNLHLRSGIARSNLTELHGNCFMEACPSCGSEYLREFAIGSVGRKDTSRRCTYEDCDKKLRDTIIGWQGELPIKEKHLAEQQCTAADVVLCLGSSLQIFPAANLPLKCLPGRGKIAIVNLQATPKDKHANLIIHGRVDAVMKGLMHHLDLPIPPYVQVNFVQVSLNDFSRPSDRKAQWGLRVGSEVGYQAPFPLVKSVEVSFLDHPKLKGATLDQQPFFLKRAILRSKPFTLVLKLNFCDGCGVESSTIYFPVDFQVEGPTIYFDREDVVQRLSTETIETGHCGQVALVERYNVTKPRKQVGLFAVSTNLVRFDDQLERLEYPRDIPNNSIVLVNQESSSYIPDNNAVQNREPNAGDSSRMPAKRLRIN